MLSHVNKTQRCRESRMPPLTYLGLLGATYLACAACGAEARMNLCLPTKRAQQVLAAP